MKELKTPEGQRYWEPTDKNDKALLAMAEGSTFGETTFPSGWVSPAGKQVAQNGILVDAT